MDQQPLYDGLIQGAEGSPTRRSRDYYKDATFGVKPADVESTTKPRSDVTIIRDKQYGIPHIYGTTRGGPCSGRATRAPRTGSS